MIVDMVDPLMPQIDMRFNFLTFGKQRGADFIRVEDEHPLFSMPFRNNLALFLDEAPKVGKSSVHSLVINMAD